MPHHVSAEMYVPHPSSSLRLEEIASGSQDCDLEIWDDLPLSESLNKFLAAIESKIAINQTDASSRKCCLDNDISKLHVDHSRLSLTPQKNPWALHTTYSLKVTTSNSQANSSRDNFLSNHEANPSLAFIRNHSQRTEQRLSHLVVIKEIFLNILYQMFICQLCFHLQELQAQQLLLSLREFYHMRLKFPVSQNISEADRSCLSSKYNNGCGEKSLSEMSEKLTTLHSGRYNVVSNFPSLENKQCCRWPKNQGNSLTISRKLTYPLEALHSTPDRSMNIH